MRDRRGELCIIHPSRTDDLQYRAKNDIYNSASAGMVAGAILARNTGPKGAFYGGLAFAGFSSVIDLWLRKEPAEYVPNSPSLFYTC